MHLLYNSLYMPGHDKPALIYNTQITKARLRIPICAFAIHYLDRRTAILNFSKRWLASVAELMY